MSLRAYKVKEPEICPSGTHLGICIQVIDLGTVIMPKYGRDVTQVRITWELPDELMEDGRPFVIGRTYTLSFFKGKGRTSALREMLEGLRGKEFTKEELDQGFDFTTLLGCLCNLGIKHETEGDRTYANLFSVQAPPKKHPRVLPGNPILFFALDEFKQEVFDKLPEFMRKRIMESHEYKKLKGLHEPDPEDSRDDVPDLELD